MSKKDRKRRKPDGSKNRHGRTSHFRQPGRARARILPVAPGYTRAESHRTSGEAEGVEDLVRQMGERLIALAVNEITSQVVEDFRRPFNCHGNAATDEGFDFVCYIKGASEGEVEYLELLTLVAAAGIASELFTATRSDLSEVLTARFASLGESAVEVMEEDNSAGVGAFAGFALGSFVRVLDTGHLLHVRLECHPPSPASELAAEFTPNRPDLS